MHRAVIVALLAACNSDGISKREAQDTFEVVNTVADDLLSTAMRSIEGDGPSAESALTIASEGADLSFEGLIRDGDGWTGDVTVVGAARLQDDPFAYELLVAFEGVGLDGGDLVLDGEFTVALSAEGTGSDLSFEADIAIDGRMDLSGDHVGQAVLDYDLGIVLDGIALSLSASGEISGHDVSGWPFGLSIPF